jgi:aspartate 1-decarboxylase
MDSSGECYVNLPDDLLGAANLKDNDKVEWVDNKNGTYTLRKVS